MISFGLAIIVFPCYARTNCDTHSVCSHQREEEAYEEMFDTILVYVCHANEMIVLATVSDRYDTPILEG